MLILAIVACCGVVADFSVSNNLASFSYLGLNVVSSLQQQMSYAEFHACFQFLIECNDVQYSTITYNALFPLVGAPARNYGTSPR